MRNNVQKPKKKRLERYENELVGMPGFNAIAIYIAKQIRLNRRTVSSKMVPPLSS
jgi:hypothetical protein